ncbi:hypothetical protein ERJ70_06100 [Sediminibacillus dalangtanensis]|uniref:DUF6449 domain-containing protein n=1 Tax=Sediminibacillus dalangtanensis TaxID=2729421 RepID=A0ABX7VPX1_9BACI|nr:DUF6449 domain-containing protein [Sediminibacillus dalangtanensis]QTM98909.1 hypothetical protein ERJ70_06100 [Sediminibacillus dalangtanensis]
MRSKTSLFNKQLLKQDLLSTGWIAIVYFAGLVFSLPLNLLMLETNERMEYSFNSLFESNGEIQLFLLYIIPVLVAVFLYRYMQVKNASDFIHSLPITRRKIFNHHFLIGIALIVMPLLLTAVILSLMLPALDLYMVYTQADIWEWFGASVAFSLLLFSAGVLIGMFTGISAVQGVLTYIFLLFPAGILVLIYSNLNVLLDGFPTSYYHLTNVNLYSPLTDFVDMNDWKFHGWKFSIYLLLSVVFYALAWFIYHKRPAEASGQPLAFHQVRPIFKYGVTTCMLLFGGFYFDETDNYFGWIVFGYVLGSFIGYLVAEMVLQKTWRVFGKWKGYVLFLAAAGAVILLLSFDITGYEKRIPEAEQIESVYFNENPMYYNDERSTKNIRKLAIQDPAIIRKIQNLHQQIVEQSISGLPENRANKEKLFFSYQLKNGSRINREYYIDLDETFAPYLKPIYESREYKEIKNRILTLDENDFSNLVIFNEFDRSSSTRIVEKTEIKEALQNLKQDIYDQTYEEMVHPIDTMAYIEFPEGENMMYQLPILRSYERFGNWLKKQGIYDQTIIQAEDISYAVILDEREESEDVYQTFYESKNGDNGLVVEDKQKLRETLETTASENHGTNVSSHYYVGLFLEGDEQPVIRPISKNNVPAFVTDYFGNK